jgi:hypothetical protein
MTSRANRFNHGLGFMGIFSKNLRGTDEKEKTKGKEHSLPIRFVANHAIG